MRVARRVPVARGPVPHGPAAYRRTLRTWGPVAALVAPGLAALGALVFLVLVPCSGRSCAVPGAVGTVLAGMAVPTAPVVGLPWRGGAVVVAAALATSVALWLGLGAVAARRATRSPAADWRDWRRSYVALVAAVWAGLAGGVVLMALLASLLR